MPEKRSGEHLARAASICQYGSQWAFTTAVEILLYTYSNNLVDPFADGLETRRDDDLRFLSIVESFITIKPLIDTLKSSQTRTARALLDRVFASAVRQGRTDVLKTLISMGFEVASRVNKRIASVLGYQSILPINFALRKGNAHLVEILLEQGATFTYYSPSSADTEDLGDCSLSSAISSNNPDTTALLINTILTMQKNISEKELLLTLGEPHWDTRNRDIACIIWKRVRELKQDGKLKEPLGVLILAIRYGLTDIVKELVPKMTDLDAECKLAIYWLVPRDYWHVRRAYWQLLHGKPRNATAIIAAAESGNLEICKMLLDAGAKPDPEPASGCSALWIAAAWGHAEVVSLLCARGADIDRHVSHTSFAKTALRASIDSNKTQVANVLLKLGAKCSAADLALAVERRNIELAQGLVKSGTEISHNVLHAAAERGSAEMIDLLTKGGAMWHCRNTWGESPLVTAIRSRCNTLVTSILEARPLQYDPAALLAATYVAALTSDTSTFSVILDQRREPPHDSWAKSLEGIALIIAVFYDDETTLIALLKSGFVLPQRLWMAPRKAYFNIFMRNGRNLYLNTRASDGYERLFTYCGPSMCRGMSLLGVAALGRQNGRMVDFLLQRGYYPNAKDLSGAAANVTPEIMERLLEEIRGDPNRIPLESALLPAFIRRGWISLVEKLLGNGVDVNAKEDFPPRSVPPWRVPVMTSLQAAAWLEDLELVGKLIKRGARVNDPASWHNGATALQYAALRGNIGIAKLLVESGANCNAPGARPRGRTALEGAAEHGHIDMLQYLLDSGAGTEGEQRGAYVRAVKRAELESQHAAAELLRSHRLWTGEDHQIYSMKLPNNGSYCEYAYESETDSEDGGETSSDEGSTTSNEGGVWDYDEEAEEPADHHQDNNRRGAQRVSVTNSQEFSSADLGSVEGMETYESAPELGIPFKSRVGWCATGDARDDDSWAPQEPSLSRGGNLWVSYPEAAERLDEPLLINADRGMDLASSAEGAQITTGTTAGQDSIFSDTEALGDSMVRDAGGLGNVMFTDAGVLEDSVDRDAGWLGDLMLGDAGGLGDIILGDAGALEDSMDADAGELENLVFEDTGGLEDFMVGDAGVVEGLMLWDQRWEEFLG